MNLRVVSARELPERLFARWADIQEHNPTLASPYFRPEFTVAVSRVRRDAFVAVLDDGAAFFPFQRTRLGFGRPIGGPVSDYHGLIAPADFQCDARELVRLCGLLTWDFDHVPADQTAFRGWRTAAARSPVVDIGRDAPVASMNFQSDHARKKRQLERLAGPVEIELDTRDDTVLRLCLEWKSAQYKRTGEADLFALPWARSLVAEIAACRGAAFSGVTSVLRVAGRPIAAHFGMRSRGVLHYWFPAYDPEFSRFSPGMLLLSAMISPAGELRLATLDLGRGTESYKFRLANRFVPLLEGSVSASPWMLACRRAGAHAVRAARSLRLQQAIPAQGRRWIRRAIGPLAASSPASPLAPRPELRRDNSAGGSGDQPFLAPNGAETQGEGASRG